jgi:hypothetical protein
MDTLATYAHPVLSEVTIIMVRGEDWLAADEADQHQYELTSGELGIVLVKEGGNAQDVLEVVREPNRSRSVEVVSYDGGVGCSRAAWEHALCRILGLPDPCFRRGVNGASGSVVEVPIPRRPSGLSVTKIQHPGGGQVGGQPDSRRSSGRPTSADHGSPPES